MEDLDEDDAFEELVTRPRPRNHVSTARSFRHDVDVLLAQHPEAFDVLLWVARPTDENEIVAADAHDGVTMLDREERRNAYDAPVLARAYVVPSEGIGFNVSDSGAYETPGTGTESLRLLLSVRATTFSLVQWREVVSLDPEEVEERTYYVSEITTAGHTLGNPTDIYECWPLNAASEVPKAEETDDSDEKASSSDNVSDEKTSDPDGNSGMDASNSAKTDGEPDSGNGTGEDPDAVGTIGG